MAQEPSSRSDVKRSNLEAIRRADAEAEKAVKRVKMLEERGVATRASTTPMDELEESATNAETSAEAMFITAEAVLTETRETIEALKVSALQQAHDMSHRHSDVQGASSSETARFFRKHESLRRGVRGRVACLNTRHFWPLGRHDENSNSVEIQVHREVTKNLTVTKVALQQQQQYRASVRSLARCLDKHDQGHEAFVADYTQAFLNAEVREGEQLYAQPPEGWNPKILMDGRRVVWKVRKAMLGLRTSPRNRQEHLSSKLKEHGFVQDEELDICIGVHADDMLAVGPSELTKNLLQEHLKDMTMRWGLVVDKPQEFLGRSLCRTPQGYTFGVSFDYVTKLCKDFGFGELKGSHTLSFEKPDDNDTILDESGQRRHRQLLGRSLWLDRPDIKNAVCQLSTHVGTATTRDGINIKRLLRYLIGNPACNMIVGCNLDVPGIAGTPQGSVVVMTDADWDGDVKDRRSYSGIAVGVKGSVENTWYASSKKQNMVCLSSGESELMALVGGDRNERPVEQNVQLLAWNDCAVQGQFSNSGVRETKGCESTHSPRGHECLLYAGLGDGTWTVNLEDAWRQSTSCCVPYEDHDSSSGSSQSSWTLTDAAICRTSMRGCRRSLPTRSLHRT